MWGQPYGSPARRLGGRAVRGRRWARRRSRCASPTRCSPSPWWRRPSPWASARGRGRACPPRFSWPARRPTCSCSPRCPRRSIPPRSSCSPPCSSWPPVRPRAFATGRRRRRRGRLALSARWRASPSGRTSCRWPRWPRSASSSAAAPGGRGPAIAPLLWAARALPGRQRALVDAARARALRHRGARHRARRRAPLAHARDGRATPARAGRGDARRLEPAHRRRIRAHGGRSRCPCARLLVLGWLAAAGAERPLLARRPITRDARGRGRPHHRRLPVSRAVRSAHRALPDPVAGPAGRAGRGGGAARGRARRARGWSSCRCARPSSGRGRCSSRAWRRGRSGGAGAGLRAACSTCSAATASTRAYASYHTAYCLTYTSGEAVVGLAALERAVLRLPDAVPRRGARRRARGLGARPRSGLRLARAAHVRSEGGRHRRPLHAADAPPGVVYADFVPPFARADRRSDVVAGPAGDGDVTTRVLEPPGGAATFTLTPAGARWRA